MVSSVTPKAYPKGVMKWNKPLLVTLRLNLKRKLESAMNLKFPRVTSLALAAASEEEYEIGRLEGRGA